MSRSDFDVSIAKLVLTSIALVCSLAAIGCYFPFIYEFMQSINATAYGWALLIAGFVFGSFGKFCIRLSDELSKL